LESQSIKIHKINSAAGEKMDEIDIKFSAEEYTTLTKFLYCADYLAASGLLSEFKGSDGRDKIYDLLTKINGYGDKINLPKSFTPSTTTLEVRFSNEEKNRLEEQIASDIRNIALNILAYDFAEQDMKPFLHNEDQDPHQVEETYDEMNQKMINRRKQIYLKEFKENGIKNLRFKMFYKLQE
jgi:hypothetical protein